MRKVYLFGGLLALALVAGCAETMPKNISYTLAQKCKIDRHLGYYLAYSVETAEYSDKATLFLSYAEVADLITNSWLAKRACLVERTLKNKPKKINPTDSPREKEHIYRERERMPKY